MDIKIFGFAEDCIQAYIKFVLCWTFNFVVDLYPQNQQNEYPTNNNESTVCVWLFHLNEC